MYAKQEKVIQKPPHTHIGCTAKPYNASRLCVLQFESNLIKVVTFMCAHSAWVGNIANAWLPYKNII